MMDIEDVLTGDRLIILKILHESDDYVMMTHIKKKGEFEYPSIKRNLDILLEEGLIEKVEFGRIKQFKINTNDPRIPHLRSLFNIWKA
jgi:Fe2+ or Zn2+ uptake regulation protein